MGKITQSQQYIKSGPGSSSGSNSSLLLQMLRPWPLPVSPRPIMSKPPLASLTKSSGVSAVGVATPGTGYTVGNSLTITGGNSATPCIVRVNQVDASGGVTAASIQCPGVYETHPANPASITGGSGNGATFNLTFNAGVASSLIGGITWSRSGDVFRLWGYSPKDVVSGYRGNGVGNGTQCIIEFDSDAPQLDFRLVGNNCQYDLYVDDQRIDNKPITTDSSGAPYTYTIDWSGDITPRKYRLMGINTSFGGVITGSAYAVWNSPEARRPRVWQLGDSYTFGTCATQGSFNDFRIICDALGLDGIADGIGGSGWTSTGSTQPQQRIQSKLPVLTFTPDLVFLSLGYNDAAAGRIELLQSNFRESVALILQICPKAKVFAMGPATPLGATTQLDAIRTAIMELCTELSIPFVDVRDWVNSANKGMYTASDNTHPTDAGYWYRGARFAQELSHILT